MDILKDPNPMPAASDRPRRARLDDAYRKYSAALAELRSRQARIVARVADAVAARKAEETRRQLRDL